jgi:hypothetical protein
MVRNPRFRGGKKAKKHGMLDSWRAGCLRLLSCKKPRQYLNLGSGWALVLTTQTLSFRHPGHSTQA